MAKGSHDQAALGIRWAMFIGEGNLYVYEHLEFM